VDWLKDPLVAAYLTDCRIRGMSNRSFPGYHSALRAYLQFLSDREASVIDVGQDDLISFIEHLRFERRSAQITIELTFSVLPSFYDFLVFKGHVDFTNLRIRLKPTAKRTNRLVFFDDEAAFIIRRWAKIREGRNPRGCPALFLNMEGDRLQRRGVSDAVTKAAERVGLHNPSSERLEDRSSPHNCRHWNTTHLLGAGMKREYMQWLRATRSKRRWISISTLIRRMCKRLIWRAYHSWGSDSFCAGLVVPHLEMK